MAFLTISQTNDNTSILTKDEYAIINYDSEFKNLYQIAYENKQEDIDVLKLKVRIFTENYLKHRFKVYLINFEHNTLGAIINFLKNSTNAITEKQAQLYESINNSYSPSHHEYESYNFEDTKSVLLSIFEDMKH